MDGQRASRNAVAGALQTALSAALMFFFYRRILDVVGAEGLGVWSVVLASTGAVRIGDLGLTGSAVKYAAGRLASGAPDAASRVVETTVVTVAALGALLAFAGYGLIDLALPLFVPPEGLGVARDLLPYAVVSLWLAIVSGAVQSGLDGCGRIDIRNGAVFAGQVVYVALGWYWVRAEGLEGLAMAQIVQGAFVAALCWILFRRVLSVAPLVPRRWDRALFREMLRYGLEYQALSVIRLFYEPVTKALMSRFGGLEAAGFFEMATLMWTKLRSFVVAAQQALTPEVAMMEETDPEATNRAYGAANGLNWYLSVPLFACVIAASPLVSMMWIGGYEGVFVAFAVVLGVGWFANALSGPGFFVLLGTGQLRGVIASHVTTGAFNALGGLVLGGWFGGVGVALAWSLALSAGALHLLYDIQRVRGVSLAVPRAIPGLVTIAMAASVVAWVTFVLSPSQALGAVAAAVVVPVALLGPLWKLPYRQRLMNVLARGLERRSLRAEDPTSTD